LNVFGGLDNGSGVQILKILGGLGALETFSAEQDVTP